MTTEDRVDSVVTAAKALRTVGWLGLLASGVTVMFLALEAATNVDGLRYVVMASGVLLAGVLQFLFCGALGFVADGVAEPLRRGSG